MHNRLIRSHDVNGPIAMMDCDKSFRYFVLGGRQNLQILQINFQAPNQKDIFTRRGMMKAKPTNQCQMARPAVNDLSWNKIQTEKIAVGSTAGMVSIYEINSEARSKLIGMKKQHESNVSKVEWSPHSGNILITASLENQLKVWDIRVQNEMFSPIIKSVEFENEHRIRDVKFSPHIEYHLALGYDSGGIEIFDTRKLIIQNGSTTSFLSEAPGANLLSTVKNFEAYSKTVNSLDWNPSVRHELASACLEKKIKVWDVGSATMVEKEKIEHVSSVSMIKWRTKESTHIGVSSLNDNQIYFYDTRYKFRPMSIFKGHTDVVKCFLYDPNEQYLVSASLVANSANSSVVVQDFRNFINPYQSCPRLPVTIDPFNNVLFNLQDVKDITSGKIQKRQLVLFQNHKQFNSASMNLKDQFKYLNENYKRTGSKEQISRHNSKVAEELGKHSCAYLWRNIFVVAFPESSQTYTIESLYEDKIDANVTITEDRIYLNEKSKYKKEVVKMDLEEVLQHFLDEDGEIQTVALAVICLINMDKNILPQLFVENILLPYIELLRKFELYAVAVRTILDSGLQSLSRASNNYTQFKIGCGQCKESIKQGVTCTKCKTIPLCILCQEPLDGLVIWCQYCAHGGHMKQYRNWFLKQDVCPYGCRHKCFTFK